MSYTCSIYGQITAPFPLSVVAIAYANDNKNFMKRETVYPKLKSCYRYFLVVHRLYTPIHCFETTLYVQKQSHCEKNIKMAACLNQRCDLLSYSQILLQMGPSFYSSTLPNGAGFSTEIFGRGGGGVIKLPQIFQALGLRRFYCVIAIFR